MNKMESSCVITEDLAEKEIPVDYMLLCIMYNKLCSKEEQEGQVCIGPYSHFTNI